MKASKNLGKLFILLASVQAIAFSLAGFIGFLLLGGDSILKSAGDALYAGLSAVEIINGMAACFLCCCFIDMATGRKPWISAKKIWILSVVSSVFWLVDTFSMYMTMVDEVFKRLEEHQSNFFYSLLHSEMTVVFGVEVVFVVALVLGIKGWMVESESRKD